MQALSQLSYGPDRFWFVPYFLGNNKPLPTKFYKFFMSTAKPSEYTYIYYL